LLDALGVAADAHDAAALASAAHALKGSVGLFSKGAVVEAARRLEQEVRNGDLTGIDGRIEEIERELSSVCADLETLRRDLSR
jgi:HPt (histidine-containing phosphotransfer) domain-containing protein